MKVNSFGKQAVMLLLCFTLSGVYGCGQRSQPATFYLLSPLSETEAVYGDNAAQPVKISVGPVRMSPYLKRKQLVIRSGENKLIIREFNRWGEPLRENFQRVLVENLYLLLSTPHIYEFDHLLGKDIDFQVIIDIKRFDVSDSGQAVLSAFWSITDSEGRRLLRDKTVIHLEIRCLESRTIVKTLNKILTDFSIEIAETILSLQ